MLTTIFWIIFGTLVGWIAAIRQDKTHPTGTSLALAVTGAIGGLAGGAFYLILNRNDILQDPGTDGLLFAVLGAIAFIFLAIHAANRRIS